MRTAAITIDVDSLRFYRSIHGHGAAATSTAEELDDAPFEPIYDIAVPRFFDLLAELDIAATFFLVGQDAARYDRAFRTIRAQRCEVASHSHRHDYRLSRADPAVIDEDLAQAESALAPFAEDGRVVGFRAPGYNVSPALLEIVVRRGYLYDSSLLPAPAYWAARATAIGRYALTGRSSASVIGHVKQFMGPIGPYRMRPAAPWRPTEFGLIELPMAVHPGTRLPLIGTSWVLLPEGLRHAWLESALRRLSVFTFEMHAIDLLDASDPGIPGFLAAAQPDLRVPYRLKREAFRALFRRLADDRPVRTLRAIAADLEATITQPL